MKKTIVTLGLVTVLLLGAGFVGAGETAVLDDTTTQALLQALDDERRAQAIYQAVMDRHGEVRPFVHIIQAEARHEGYLLDLMAAYEVTVPEDRWARQALETPATLREACAAAIEAEQANIALYDDLLAKVENSEVRTAFDRLQAASRDHHLPAFERCAQRGGPGKGPGGKGGQGGCGKCGACATR